MIIFEDVMISNYVQDIALANEQKMPIIIINPNCGIGQKFSVPIYGGVVITANKDTELIERLEKFMAIISNTNINDAVAIIKKGLSGL